MSRRKLDTLKAAFAQALMHETDFMDDELVLWIFLTDAEVPAARDRMARSAKGRLKT